MTTISEAWVPTPRELGQLLLAEGLSCSHDCLSRWSFWRSGYEEHVAFDGGTGYAFITNVRTNACVWATREQALRVLQLDI